MNCQMCLWLILRVLVYIAANEYRTDFTEHSAGVKAIKFLANTKKVVGADDVTNANY